MLIRSGDFEVPDIPKEMTLDHAGTGEILEVLDIQAPEQVKNQWSQWFEAIGLCKGETIKIMSRGLIGGNPLAVRIGQSTFALRRDEAACITVRKLAEQHKETRTTPTSVSAIQDTAR